MIKKAETLIVLFVVLSLWTGSLRAEIVTLTPNSNSIVQDGIEYYMQTNKAVYDLGESVEMLYRVTNLGDTDVVLGTVIANRLAYYDFRIMQDGIHIWEYPYLPVVMGFTGFILGPYESKEGHTIWNMMNDNGTLPTYDDFPVNPGIYDVIGELDLIGIGDKRVPVSVSIEIIPEPCSLVLLGAGFMGIILERKKDT